MPVPTKPSSPRKRWWALTAIVVVVVVALTSAMLRDTKTSSKAATTPIGSTTVAPVVSSGDEEAPGGPGAPTIEGSAATSATASGAGACRRGPPLANVYHPNRLTVVKACITVAGRVESVRSEPDGDTHFDLALDPQYADLLTAANRSVQHGWLVAEIVPADEPGCTPGEPPRPATGTYDYGVCTGADELAPAPGQHVWVTGPYVLDEDHGGWAEIHPVWGLSSAAPAASPAASAPTLSSPTGSSPASNSSVRILSVTSPVARGSEASLVAQAWAAAACDLDVTLPSGARSQSQGLGPAQADSAGRVEWSWRTGTRTTPGTATATVACASASATAQFQITG